MSEQASSSWDDSSDWVSYSSSSSRSGSEGVDTSVGLPATLKRNSWLTSYSRFRPRSLLLSALALAGNKNSRRGKCEVDRVPGPAAVTISGPSANDNNEASHRALQLTCGVAVRAAPAPTTVSEPERLRPGAPWSPLQQPQLEVHQKLGALSQYNQLSTAATTTASKLPTRSHHCEPLVLDRAVVQHGDGEEISPVYLLPVAPLTYPPPLPTTHVWSDNTGMDPNNAAQSPNLADLLTSLSSDEDASRKMAAFKLQSLINDPSFAEHFVLAGGLPLLRTLILESTGNTLAYSLASFARLLEVDQGWEAVDDKVVEKARTIYTAIIGRRNADGIAAFSRLWNSSCASRWLTFCEGPWRYWYQLSPGLIMSTGHRR